jgi:transaldolase
MRIPDSLKKDITAERQRREAEAGNDLRGLIAHREAQRVLDNLLYFTPPERFLAGLEALEGEVRSAFGAAVPAQQARYLRFLGELALALSSFLPRWNLQNAARHGDAALSDAQVALAAERARRLAAELAAQAPGVAAQVLAEWRQETARRLEAEAASDPQGGAAALTGDSIADYLANLSAELAASNLRRIAELRRTGQTRTEIGNDFAAFLPYALLVGACFVTCNPPLVERAWASDPDHWTPVVDRMILNHPHADEDRLALLTTGEVVLEQMRLLRPIFLLSEGNMGSVCLQVNPRKHDDAGAMVSDALFIYEWLRDGVGGGVPNVVFKLPGTQAGLEACRALTGRGIGVTITVNFGLFQHLAFAEAIHAGQAIVAYLVEMNGRLAFPVRDELVARLGELAAHGIDEAQAREAAAWAGVAVVKRAERLLAAKGYDPRRMKTLVASLRFYQGAGYTGLPSPFPDITEVLGAGVISVFPNIRAPFDAQRGLSLDPRSVEAPVPERVLDVLAHSELFKQAYYVEGDGERFRPATVLRLEDQARVAAWPPVYNTLTEFIKSYDTTVTRILERKQLLAA